jgi:DNA-binding NarL/FixJ family response regulator
LFFVPATSSRFSRSGTTGVSATTAAVVAADSALREQLVALLEAEGAEVQAEAADADSLAVPGSAPQVGVLALDPAAVRSAVRALKHDLAETSFVAVIEGGGEHMLRRSLKDGLNGIVLASRADTTLGPTVRAVAAGQLVVPREFEGDLSPPPLSNREKQVLGLVVLGFSNQEIAQKLFLAESTVKSHLYTAFGKLGVRSRQEAAAMILAPDSGLGLGVLAIHDSALASPA